MLVTWPLPLAFQYFCFRASGHEYDAADLRGQSLRSPFHETFRHFPFLHCGRLGGWFPRGSRICRLPPRVEHSRWDQCDLASHGAANPFATGGSLNRRCPKAWPSARPISFTLSPITIPIRSRALFHYRRGSRHPFLHRQPDHWADGPRLRQRGQSLRAESERDQQHDRQDHPHRGVDDFHLLGIERSRRPDFRQRGQSLRDEFHRQHDREILLERVLLSTLKATITNSVNGPAGIAIDSSGNIYVANSNVQHDRQIHLGRHRKCLRQQQQRLELSHRARFSIAPPRPDTTAANGDGGQILEFNSQGSPSVFASDSSSPQYLAFTTLNIVAAAMLERHGDHGQRHGEWRERNLEHDYDELDQFHGGFEFGVGWRSRRSSPRTAGTVTLGSSVGFAGLDFQSTGYVD